MTTTFDPLPDLAAVDAAHGAKTETGARRYAVDPHWRRHVDAERVRLMEAATPTPGSAAGVTAVDGLGRRQHVGGQPDPRVLDLAAKLAARVGHDGRRLVETQADYREAVEATWLDAMKGRPWDNELADMAANLDAEKAAQAADAGRYRGVETQPDGMRFDRTDPMFQQAAEAAESAGLNQEQFGKVLSFISKSGLLGGGQ
jgi:hypothetical protein